MSATPPLERFYAIATSHYFARYETHGHYVGFAAWEVTAYTDMAPLYGEDFGTETGGATPLVRGHAKWDGCTNYEFPEKGMLHDCGREGLVNIGVLLGRVWDQCHALMPESDCKMEMEPAIEDGPFPWEVTP